MGRFSTIKSSTLIAKFRYEKLGNADKILIFHMIQGISPCLISATSEVNVYTLVHFVGHCISWGIYPYLCDANVFVVTFISSFPTPILSWIKCEVNNYVYHVVLDNS